MLKSASRAVLMSNNCRMIDLYGIDIPLLRPLLREETTQNA